MPKPKVIIIGSGLAGLSAGLELANQGYEITILEANSFIGGRTASWNQNGMEVESGLHRVLGFYTAFPRLVKKAGLKMKDVVIWEDEVEIKVANGPSFIYGASPIFRPFKTFSNPFRNKLISWREAWKLLKFLISGITAYIARPEQLDKYSTLEYAQKFALSDETIKRFIVPFTSGLFFLPPSKYSAYVFFGPIVHAFRRLYRVRIGAFRGGMSKVLTEPIARKITQLGGSIITNARLTRLNVDNNRIQSVQVNGKTDYLCDYAILAAPLGPVQEIIRASSLQSTFPELLSLEPMPEVNLQLEFSRAAWPVDRTVFGVGTQLITFAEQSRTTFKGKSGRMSIILTPPEEIIGKKDKEIFEIFRRDAPSLGIDPSLVTDYRVIRHSADFYLLSPHRNKLRPKTGTNIQGLYLAGDYVKQSFFTTMEGAIIAGNNAARELKRAHRNHR
ncbi:hydroxysqualene dehydroxylase [Nitrosomonas communis]|uniref:15-cis-phytoene desaturase n=1 Tax=Nitrosomonas communis TaxID=44574 RepID=A0A1I4NME7_9PROT|nr:FAD-dependent oxidoreductase [Nitrosomonas communis]SFM16646.1 15-cis-phytoene desaturase [Nitrosomonas communis]